MMATDLAPDRLTRARYKIRDLLAARQQGQTALVVFAGRPFEVTPLTDDVNTISSQLEIMTPALMPVPGSDLLGAYQQASALLRQAGHTEGDILLGVIGAVRPSAARAMTEAMTAYLTGLPEPLYALFGTGYLGYAAARQWGKVKGVDK
jgi:Ca-activated chloride channel family protein